MNRSIPSSFALAAASLFLGACGPKAGETETPSEAVAVNDAKIKCFGANECKGQGACDVPDGRVSEGSQGHDCAGYNACQGKGWISMTADECEAKGGEPL